MPLCRVSRVIIMAGTAWSIPRINLLLDTLPAGDRCWNATQTTAF